MLAVKILERWILTSINLSLSHTGEAPTSLLDGRLTCDHQQPKSLRAGPGWFVASVPLPSSPNTRSNPREGRVLKKKKSHVECDCEVGM